MNEPEMAMGTSQDAFMEESPYAIPSRKMAVWLFILSDAVTFAAILVAYGYVRLGSADWPRPFESSSIVNGVVMTLILLLSSVTMLAALDAARKQNRPRCLSWLGVTMLLGTLFAALHLHEWMNMFHEGWSLFRNPTGGSVQFGATFFCVTGLHLMHIIAGVVAVAIVAVKYNQAHVDAGHVEAVGLYWHFVDVVWMFVFPLLYLMNAK